MTSTELAADPRHSVQVGDRISGITNYDDQTTGVWAAPTVYDWCGEYVPDGHSQCSRPRHPAHWKHIAATSSRVLEVWGGGALDPYGDVQVGDTRAEIEDYSGVYARIGSWCQERVDGYYCSRPRGHDSSWKHIAANDSRVVGVSGERDPFASVQAGMYAPDLRNYRNNVFGIYVEGDRCEHEEAGKAGFCTRPERHPGKHVCTRPNGTIRWVADVSPAAAILGEIQDPEDGTPPDPDDHCYTTAPPVGEVVRLKDRENRLYVMGHRSTPEVEVLDLKTKDLRAIPISKCVQIDSALSLDELQWVAKWYADHRQSVRKVAVREYRNERWCMEGLNKNLANLGLEKYEPTLRGQISVRLPFECPDIHATQSVIEEKVREALRAPEVAVALRMALPSIEGVELEPDALKVLATDFVRK